MNDLSEIFFLQERDKKSWSIKECVHQVTDLKKHLLFIHAWSGCDSTSAILCKGKPSFLKLVKKSAVVQSASDTISDYWATQEEVGYAAVKIFTKLYFGTTESSLSKMRLVSISDLSHGKDFI